MPAAGNGHSPPRLSARFLLMSAICKRSVEDCFAIAKAALDFQREMTDIVSSFPLKGAA
jgi:hypothetical protein